MLEKYIDHTLLRPDATAEEIKQLAAEAKAYGFASVCVQPARVALAAAALGGAVPVCTVLDFPHGAGGLATKTAQARQALADGAAELDLVQALGAVRDGDWETVAAEIRAVKELAGEKIVKVILETSYLTEAEIVRSCEVARAAGADFVKTSTGFASGGATAEVVRLMRRIVGDAMGVKASGGIRDYATACAMIEAGASRLGASAGVAICQEERRLRD